MKNRFSVQMDGIEFAISSKAIYAAAIADLWNKHSGESARAVVVDRKKQGTARKCSECQSNPADYPSSICAGCEAYAEHQNVY